MVDAFSRFASLLAGVLFVTDPAAVAVRTQQTAASAIVTLEWSSPVTYSSSIDGRELLVQFDRPLAVIEPLALEKALPAWVEAATTGYDTVLIRASRDASFSVRGTGLVIVIEMNAATVEAAPTLEDTQAELRLDLLRAQLLASEGHWTRADRVLAQAVERHPGDADVAALRAQVRADQSARTRLEVDVKTVQGAQTERVARVSTHGFVAGYLRVGGMVEENQTTLANRVYDRQRAELYVQQDFDSGTELRVSAFGTRSSIGGGVQVGRADATGTTQALVEYRRPFWELVEGLLGNGTRDHAALHREQRFGSRVSGRVTAAFNRYGLESTGDLARSMAFDAGLNVTLRRTNPSLGVEYGADVESFRFVTLGTIPLVGREVHAGSALAQIRVGRRFSADASSGYVWDRLGGRGPFTAARIGMGGPGRVAFELSYDRRLNSFATGQVVTRMGASLRWRFD